MIHPLLNESSAGYYDTGKTAAIYEYEKTATVAGMVAICEYEISKYKSRLGKKSLIKGKIKTMFDAYYTNRPEMKESFESDHRNEVMFSDMKKIDTWKAYKDLLIPLLHRGYAKMPVCFALEQEGIELEYQI